MGGSRAGSRRGPRRRTRPTRQLLAYAAGITLLVLAWGYLVWAAIDFGASARGGQGVAWAFLALASIGAVACLFAGLMLGVRLLRLLGILDSDSDSDSDSASDSGPGTAGSMHPAAPPVPRGGKRAAR